MFKKELLKQRVILYVLGAIIGAASGLGAVIFRYLVLYPSYFFAAIPAHLGMIGWVIAPVLGGFLVAGLTYKYAPEAKGHGVPEVITSYSLQAGRMRDRIPIVKSIASGLSISSGGSCGREGPIAQIGAGIGSVIATRLNLGKKERKTLLVCGLSSGIAATFNAPLGGTLFGIEIIAGGIVGFSIVPVILASVVGTAVSYTLIGPEVSFRAPPFALEDPAQLIFYLFLGLLLGVGSIVWNRGFYYIEVFFERLKISGYILPAIGGLLVGLMGILSIFLENMMGYSGLFAPDEPYFPAIMGVGYAFIDATLAANVALGVLVLFGILKAIATSLTLGSGGSGGVVAPTLYIGAAFGGAFGLFFSIIFPSIITQPMAFALVGMAALIGASNKAPVTSIMIVMELTRGYSMILPLMAAVSASYLVSYVIDETSISTMKLVREGVILEPGLHVGALKAIEVGEVMTCSPTILRPDMTTEDVLEIVDKTHHTKYPVIDYDGRVVGSLITEDLFSETKSGEERIVRNLMNKDFLRISPSCRMDSALHAMMIRDEGHAVVSEASEPEKMLGFITKADVLKAYEIAIFRLQQRGMDIEDIGPPDIVEIP